MSKKSPAKLVVKWKRKSYFYPIAVFVLCNLVLFKLSKPEYTLGLTFGLFCLIFLFEYLCYLFNKTLLVFDGNFLKIKIRPFGFGKLYSVKDIKEVNLERSLNPSDRFEFKIAYKKLDKTPLYACSRMDAQSAHAVFNFLMLHIDGTKQLIDKTPQTLDILENTAYSNILHIQQGQWIVYQGTKSKLLNRIQHVWINETSHVEYQAIGSTSREQLFFLIPNSDDLVIIKEERLLHADFIKFEIDDLVLKHSLFFLGRTFKLIEEQIGESYSNSNLIAAPIRQWLYHDVEEHSYIRITKQKGQWASYYGQEIKTNDFKQDSLDLDANPILLKHKLKRK